MTITFMKRGKEAAEEIKKADAQAAAKAAESHKMWRFRMKENEMGALTFVDGNLTPEGHLDANTFREHTLYYGGNWTNFVCTQDLEPCPICEGGDSPSLVGVLTVIDHRIGQSKDKTKTFKDQPRLFVAKKEVLKNLQVMATKRGGLAGCRYDVKRGGPKSHASEEHFDFTDKTPVEVLEQKYTREFTNEKGVKIVESVFKPADYDKEIVYRTAKELREMGFGKGGVTVGDEKAPTDEVVAGAANLEQQL